MLQQLFQFMDSLPDADVFRKTAEIKAVVIDFDRHLVNLHLMTPDIAALRVHKIAEFFRKEIRPDLVDHLRLSSLQIYHDILSEDVEHLIRVFHHRKLNYDNVPIIEAETGFEMVLPDELYTISRRSTENEYRMVPPRVFIHEAELNKSAIRITGHLYYCRVNVDHPDAQSVEAFLYHEQTGREIPLPCRAKYIDYLTQEQGVVVNCDDYRDYRYNYDYAGFELELDLNALEELSSLCGKNLVFLSYCHRLYSGTTLLKNVKTSVKKQMNKAVIPIDQNYEAQISFPQYNIFTLQIRPRPVPEPPPEHVKTNLFKNILGKSRK